MSQYGQKRQRSPTNITPPHKKVERNMASNLDVSELKNVIAILLDEKLSSLDEKFAPLATKNDLVAIQNETVALREENTRLWEEVRALQQENKLILDRVENLEVECRQKNLIFRGLQSFSNSKDLETVVSTFCDEVLKVPVSVDNIAVRPLGQKDNPKSPLLVTFAKPNNVLTILKSTKCLKDTGYVVHCDLPQSVRISRGRLLLVRKKILKINNDISIKLKGATLRVGSHSFRWCPQEGIVSAGKPAIGKLNELIGVDLSKFIDEVRKGTLAKDYFKPSSLSSRSTGPMAP